MKRLLDVVQNVRRSSAFTTGSLRKLKNESAEDLIVDLQEGFDAVDEKRKRRIGHRKYH